MVVKKKAPKVEAVAVDDVKLKSLTDSLSVEGDSRSTELARVLKDSLSSSDPVEQIQLISKAGVLLEQLREDECTMGPLLQACMSTLAFLFTTLPAKNPLKRAVASALGSGPDWLQEQTVGCLSESLSSCLSSTSTDHCSHLTDSITSCLDGFKIGEKCVHHLLIEVLQFFQRTFDYYVEQNRGLSGRHVAQAQLMQSCLAAVKASMLVVQRSQEPITTAVLSASDDQSDLHQALSGLLSCYTCILTDEEFVQTVQSTAGMAVVLLIRSTIGNGDDVPVIVAGLLQCSVDAGSIAPQWLRQSCAGLYESGRPAAVALYLSHGALAMLSWRGKTLVTVKTYCNVTKGTARLDQTTYILDYFLPKLLRCNPSSLSHMVQALQKMPACTEGSAGSRGALGALMTCLRAARSQGVLKSVEEELWGGLVPLPLMRQALVHKHDQVRMDALGLVCESHRSTETLSRQEIELIRHFLPFNLNSQSPGVRQQTVSLLKKLLCRVKDSAQLLQKKLDQHHNHKDQQVFNMYQEFLRWFCETLFQVFHPGASFSRCLMALHLLGLIAEHFTFNTGCGFALGESVSFSHAQAVLYCLASNFLEVKHLACNLLQKLPPAAVRLQVSPERLQSLLQVALDLSTSTKPFDSVTAAHLLNLLLHQPGLQAALLRCIQKRHIPVQPPALIQSQTSEAASLEQNTLAVVQWLMVCLKEEVLKAESSLLQAAASYPLYGRAHCITAVLQQLNTGSLVLLSEWRAVVSELIGLCYRMSDVVSPVVQSSSPEGLIPMDTESETSAGLQKILQEIQPRDTNDFFTSARELDPSESDCNSEQKEPENAVHKPQSCNSGGGDGEAYRVTAQMVLVCCWRTMKEVSMLLGHLCQSMPLCCFLTHADGRGVVTEDQVEGVGQYFREQLLQSRHRGAFELAYVGFVRLTEMLCRSGSATLQQLPAHWLKEVLEEVKSSDPSSKLCATRRSAGIPFYIQALLSSEPKSSSCGLLKMTMRSLMALAMPSNDADTESSSVPQVHALNILRALYRDTRLGENIVPFVSDGMQAAILGFTSPVWAVRNSSTLLFSTLITRIFGVKKGKDEHSKKNRMTGREFFTRFPALYPFLLSQLQEAAASVNSDSGQVKLHPSLFLLLLVLGRLYPSPMDGSSSPLGLAPFMPLIIRCGRSAVYRTREMAARALVPFVLVTEVPSTIQTLLEELPQEPGPGLQQNHIHGTLLQVLSLLRSYLADTHRPQSGNEQGCDLSSALFPRLWLATRQNLCLVTRGAFLDLLGCLCGCLPVPVSESQLKKLHEEALQILMASELVAPQGTVKRLIASKIKVFVYVATQYLQSLAHIAVSVCVESPHLWDCPESAGFQRDLLERLLRCLHYEVRLFALDQLLRRLQKTEEESQHRGQGPLPFDLSVSSLTSLAFHETYPGCQAKVLQVLAVLPLSSLLPWRDGMTSLSCLEVLEHLLTLLETSTHSVELYCAALSLTSQLVLHLAESTPQDVSEAAVVCLSRWGALVMQGCAEDQPAEVKLVSAEVLVKAVPTLLTAPALPLGITHTVALWKSLFTLLQDEDQDVRDGAADFTCYIPAHLHNTGVSTGAVSPPVALEMGVGLLCQLFQMWGQLAAGMVNLIQWLLGDEQSDTRCEESLDLDEEFLFEKGDLNLWAEPLLWARMLHRHLSALVSVTHSPDVSAAELDRLSAIAKSNALAAQRSMKALPALPQFSATIEYAKISLRKERASLALNLLDTLRSS
uniref:tRNA (32-2'-O)-methyltransferase regulator THADA n=2 Tax=Sinocyclocheilus anshuiensis TaxID=1608454 RepID=A0A671MCS0_9TELE